MKKLGKLKLNQMCKSEMEKRELSKLMGGENCECGCAGTSSSTDNFNENYDNDYSQSGGDPYLCACDTMSYTYVLT